MTAANQERIFIGESLMKQIVIKVDSIVFVNQAGFYVLFYNFDGNTEMFTIFKRRTAQDCYLTLTFLFLGKLQNKFSENIDDDMRLESKVCLEMLCYSRHP